LATPVQRFAAWVLDAFIAGIVFTPLSSILWSSNPSPWLFVALLAPAMVLLFVYLVLFDGGRRGATPGKRIVGIRVADARTGGPLGYRRALIRRLGYYLGGLVLYIGWLWLLFDSRRQAWHDKVAGSVVVTSR
jgi:uncharacterized RDD family membrane protein YckC